VKKPLAWVLALLALACNTQPPPTSTATPSEPSPFPSPSASAPAPVVAAAEPDAGSDAAPSPEPEAPLEGADFAAQARAIYRVAACGGAEPVPAAFDTKVVDAHCAELAKLIAEYKQKWLDIATPFLAKLRPAKLPDRVVYPFGGGDLLHAMVTYPDAAEYTTISLEQAADVRKVDALPPHRLRGELALYRAHLAKLFSVAHSRTDNLGRGSKELLPGQIVFSMVALRVHGYEPTSLRYFRFKPDGTLDYLDEGEIKQLIAKAKARGKDPDEEVFGNMELRFRKLGDPAAKPRVLRHVVFNLDDWHMKADPSLLKHLEAKGKVSAMTKAATHLLWLDAFSIIRDYMLTHTDFMISDSTGPTVRHAKAAGFVQDTYGTFLGPSEFGAPKKRDADELVALFKANPHVDVPFYYGYPDSKHHGHIIVTRKPDVTAASP
jgi:hypothetical protein